MCNKKFKWDCLFSMSTKKQFQLKFVKSKGGKEVLGWGGERHERHLQLISPTLAGVPCMDQVCTSPT